MLGTKLLDRYLIESQLGQGGMGAVYKARDTLLGRPVAIKVLAATELGTQGRTRLLNEARAAAGLNHPNIVSIYDAGEWEKTAYIIMELIEGESLNVLKGNPLETIIPFLLQICSALQHAHQHGIIHRDLKPENILITQSSVVKLTDFGLARTGASRVTTEGAVVGTVFYMAPEQALGKNLDGRTDLYSLGIILYELFTGRLPFTAADPVAVVTQHLYAPLVSPRVYNPSLPELLEQTITRLLSKNKEDRPADAAEVRQTLAYLLNGKSLGEQNLTPESLASQLPRGILVGRERELAEAKALWMTAAQGIADERILLVTGESGVGKTPLIQELSTFAEMTGGYPLKTQCFEGSFTPYIPLADIIRNGLFSRGTPPTSPVNRDALSVEIPDLILADLLTLVPDLRLAFPDLKLNPVLEAQTEQVRLFESAVAFFTQLQARKPILIVLEDAHWADGGTLFLLRHLARRARASQLHLLMVFSYQETELDSNLPLHNVLTDIHRDHLAARIKLTRFDIEGTRLVLENLLRDKVSSDLVDSIYCETEGNLFFIEELVADLLENGFIARKEHTWGRAREESMRLPQSVRATIQERISRLAETTQETLRLAAVIGHEFDFQTLQKASDYNEETLIAALEDAVFHQIIQEAPGKGGETFIFQHGLFPSTLRESLSSLRRHRLHRRVAGAVSELHPNNYAILAYHLQAAGDIPAARDHYIKAARYAAKVVAYADASKLYSQALELFPPDSPEQFDLLIERLHIYNLLSEHALSKADAQSILELARVLRLPSRRCDGLICLAEIYNATAPGQATVTAEEAANLARQIGDTLREARAMLILGLSQRQRGDFLRARQVIEAASEKFMEAGMLSETAASQHTLALVLSDLGEQEASFETAMTALALSRQAGDRQQEATSLRRIAITLEAQGKFAESLPYAEAALRLHRELGDREQEVHALNVLGLIHAHLRHSTQAEAFFVQSIETAEKTGFSTGMTSAISNMIELIYRPRGDLEAGMYFINSQIDRIEPLNDPYVVMDLQKNSLNLRSGFGLQQEILNIVRLSLVNAGPLMANSEKSFLFIMKCRALMELGEYQLSLNAADEAINLIQGESIPYLIVYVSLMRFMVYLRMGIEPLTKFAQVEIDIAYSSLQGHNITDELAEIRIYDALLDLYLGRTDVALEKAEKAFQQFARLPFPLQEVHLVYSLALFQNNRTEEAITILKNFYDWIHIVASKTKNDQYRKYWLESNLLNKNIIRYWSEAQAGKTPNIPLIM